VSELGGNNSTSKTVLDLLKTASLTENEVSCSIVSYSS